ncbi:MAG: hypothetical protein KDA44_23815, partial [Planctomycetales bacterium]|nr:hypothetical protein [Planctomycetales bacterium]
KLTPEELAAYEAIYFDLEGRADDEQFLLPATALPELGLIPDRRADHRCAMKVVALLGGKQALRRFYASDPRVPRRQRLRGDATWEQWSHQLELRDFMTARVIADFRPTQSATAAERRARNERYRELLAGAPASDDFLDKDDRLEQQSRLRPTHLSLTDLTSFDFKKPRKS